MVYLIFMKLFRIRTSFKTSIMGYLMFIQWFRVRTSFKSSTIFTSNSENYLVTWSYLSENFASIGAELRHERSLELHILHTLHWSNGTFNSAWWSRKVNCGFFDGHVQVFRTPEKVLGAFRSQEVRFWLFSSLAGFSSIIVFTFGTDDEVGKGQIGIGIGEAVGCCAVVVGNDCWKEVKYIKLLNYK